MVLITAFISCKKKDVIVEPKMKEDVSISDLKKYFGQLTRLDTSVIEYNSKLQKFFIHGKEQISYKELKESFLKSPVVQYKDGKPVTQ